MSHLPFVLRPVPPIASVTPMGNAGGDHALLETVRRLLRQPAGWVALVLRLSAMDPPAPRPHHRRVARALLQDAAQRHEGQVFAMPNGDLVLLHRPLGDSAAVLGDTLGRLLRIDAPDPALLAQVWTLSDAAEGLLAYARERAQEAAGAAHDDDLPARTGAVDAIDALIERPHVADLLRRQTAILFGAAEHGRASLPVTPLFREVAFSLAGMEAQMAAGDAGPAPSLAADPFLFRDMAARLDRRMLALLPGQLDHGGPLDLAASGVANADGGATPLAVHLNLTLASIEGAAFQALADAARARGVTLGVEVSLLEACAEPAAFARARRVLTRAGCALALDHVSHLSLTLTRPWLLGADMIKLDWSPRLPDLPVREAARLAAAIGQAGPHTIVLRRAETEAAVRWGMARGIRRFQGRHVDAMLGAARILACPAAADCTLRQCIERAATATAAGRRFCRNTALLDAGAPAAQAANRPGARVPP